MKKYQSYKPSGVEWIGEIPEGWNVKKLKELFVNRNEKNEDLCEDFLSLTKDRGVIPYSEKGNVGNKTSEDIGKYKKVYPEDIVVNPMNIIIGSVGISKYNGVLSNVYIVLKPTKILSGYGSYIFHHKSFQLHLKKICYGIMELRESLNKIEFFVEKLPLPPLSEQHQIVEFLDSKTELINRLISTKERKITLLKEQRTSLINQVVTKGLNPNVKMKDSGVEWIGEIPEGWNIVPLKILGGFQNGISKGSEFFGHGLPFMNYGDVYKNEITPTDVEGKVDSSDSERNQYSISRGDIFFTRTSESKDDIGVSSTCLRTIDNCVFSGFVIRFRFYGETHLPEYSRYHFQTHWKKVFIESKMNIVTRSSLSQQVLGQVPVLIPSIEEQLQIVEYLDSKTKEIDDLVQLEQKKIDLLKEYRQSLISEVVTGKIKVTN
jgi:type I restriction enzyme S subunit